LWINCKEDQQWKSNHSEEEEIAVRKEENRTAVEKEQREITVR